MNHAISLNPFNHKKLLQQYPKADGRSNSDGGLLSVETHLTAYQYPFCLCDLESWFNKEYIRDVLIGIGGIGEVGGNNSRTLFDFSPRSIVIRVTSRASFGLNPYGFGEDGTFSELSRINANDIVSGDEFWIGGEIVRKGGINENLGIHLYENCETLLKDLGKTI